jgi:hypothetical protein
MLKPFRSRSLWYGVTLVAGLVAGALFLPPVRGFQMSVSQIYITDVFGLPTELAIRPTMGVGYTPNAVVYVDNSGSLESVLGPAGNCVTVGGQSVPCGSPSGGGTSAGSNFVDGEVPSGIINGLNVTFVLAHIPSPASSLHLFLNGVRLSSPLDYSVTAFSGSVVFATAPRPSDQIFADYRY